MKFFDSHCHLNDERFAEDVDAVVESITANMLGCLCAGCDLPSSQMAVELARSHSNIYASAGLHPHDARLMTPEMQDSLSALLPDAVALGEIGLDYHYDFSPREVQQAVFAQQLDVAIDKNMPVIIHEREAWADTLRILQARKGKLSGVFHCFSGSVETAREVLDMGFFISLAGPVTFRNANKLLDVARYVPEDRLLIETDSPYMTPVPFRGQRNRPEYVEYVAAKIAELRETDVEHIAQLTYENARVVFRLGGQK